MSAGHLYGQQHPFDIVQHLLIAKADDLIAVFLKAFRPGLVMLYLQIVDVTIYFYYQATLCTIEVGDEGAKRMLPPEFEPGELPIT
jgi:hypothetical protein